LRGENKMNRYMENKIIGIIELNSELNESSRKTGIFVERNENTAGRKNFLSFILIK